MNNKTLHMAAFVLVIVGAVNWGLVGLAQTNLVEMVLGTGSMPTMLVYVLVGLSGVYLVLQHKADCKTCA